MILMYHKVAPENPTIWWVTVDQFWSQMQELSSYQVVSLDDYDPKDPTHVAITFDGVYECIHKYAAPILKSFGYPYELFVGGDTIGKENVDDQHVEPPAQFASVEQLEELAQSGGKLQWHSASHRDLSKVPLGELDEELTVPGWVQKADPAGFRWFAYPYGNASEVLIQKVKTRFSGALGCNEGSPSEPFHLPRKTVTQETSFSRSRVSLIIPNYNYGAYLSEAIESALLQSVPPDEILFIDDASDDRSMEVVEHYRDRIRIVQNDKNLGIVDNFNKAVSLTSGDYICFLGADNRFRSDYIQRCKAALDADDSIGIASTNIALFGPRAELLAKRVDARLIPEARDVFLWEFPDPKAVSLEEMKKTNSIHGSSMYRRDAFEKVGGYIKGEGPEDHDLFVRIFGEGYGATLCKEPLLEYRQHSREQANTKLLGELALAHARKDLQETKRYCEKLEGDFREVQAECGRLAGEMGKSEERAALQQKHHEEALRSHLKALEEIHRSIAWKLVLRLRKIRDALLGSGTLQRRLYNRVLRALKGERVAVAKKGKAKTSHLPPPTGVKKNRSSVPELVRLAVDSSVEVPSVDIVVVTYNSARHIGDCLENILSQGELKDRVSVIVVDNHSSDETLGVLKGFEGRLPSLQIIKNRRNRGFGAAVNQGAALGCGDYVFVLNPDTRLEPGALGTLSRDAVRTQPHGFAAWEARQAPYEHPKVYDPVTLETNWASGACVLLHRDAFEKVGGFDENIFLYAEDVDLSWRLRKRGYKLRFVPQAVVIHDTYQEANEVKPAQFYYSIISNSLLRLKHGSLRDIAAFVVLLSRVLRRPPALGGARLRLLGKLFLSAPRALRSLAWRFANKNTGEKGIVEFPGFDYQRVRREGAFFTAPSVAAKPLVSIVVRTMDRPNLLREALASIRNQSYRPLEVIVVEDGPDCSSGVIEEFGDLDVRYHPLGQNIGRCRAGNYGLEVAKGKYVNFLDDDDLLFSDHVETLVKVLENAEGARVAYSTGFEVPTEFISIDPLVYSELVYKVVHSKPFDRADLEEFNYLPINCVLFERGLFLESGGLDEELDVLEDWDLWLRYAKVTDFVFVEKTTAIYRVPVDHGDKYKRQAILDAAYHQVRQKNKAA